MSRVSFGRKLCTYRLIEFKVEALIVVAERGTIQEARIRSDSEVAFIKKKIDLTSVFSAYAIFICYGLGVGF